MHVCLLKNIKSNGVYLTSGESFSGLLLIQWFLPLTHSIMPSGYFYEYIVCDNKHHQLKESWQHATIHEYRESANISKDMNGAPFHEKQRLAPKEWVRCVCIYQDKEVMVKFPNAVKKSGGTLYSQKHI